ncbi:tRNA pseudouridine(38-40) synthase TruA [Okibacterium endophyticum]
MHGQEQDARRFRLDIAYDGTGFSGWSRQPGLRTVQGVLEEAIATVLGRHDDGVTLAVAGRTDAGVHAIGQVAHLDLNPAQVAVVERRRSGGQGVPSPAQGLVRRINGVLGQYPDVVATDASEAPAGFDARFSAIWRRYRYRLADLGSTRNPLERASTVWYPHHLDVEAMDKAAETLVGLHDFAAYCRPREGATTIRTLLDYRWWRDDEGVVIAEVKADAFCHSMVRALVGACAAVGQGKLDVSDVVRLRDAQRRTSAFPVMPARGLTLTQVGYPEDDLLAARAELTRAKRTLPGTDDDE